MTIRGLAWCSGAALAGAAAFLYYAFGAFLPWREDREADAVAELAGMRAGTVVGEIGAGQGRFSVAFARRVGAAGRVYATELSPEAVAGLAARAEAAGLRNLIEARGDRDRTNLPDSCYDVLFLRNVYHHVTEPDAFGAALRRAIRNDGRVIVADFEPGALWFHGGRPSDAAERRPGHGVAKAAVIAEVTAAGFEVEQEFARWRGPMWLVVFRARAPQNPSESKTSHVPRGAAPEVE